MCEIKIREDYAKILEDGGYSVNNLPILNLGNRGGHTDYIDFISVREMKSSVMKFIDKFNRSGFVLYLRCKHSDYIDRKVTLAIFQRYTNGGKWTFGWGGSDCFLEMIGGGNTYFVGEGNIIKPVWLMSMLRGEDPIVELGQIRQLRTTPKLN
jgi:hypothetical protein